MDNNGMRKANELFIDAMMTEHAELRLLVRKLARRLPVDDKTRQQADDYLRRTFKASDVLRDDAVGKPEQTALQSSAPVTDAQREALDDMPDIVGTPNSRVHQRSIINLLRWYDSHHETIRAALSAPVARVDVEKLRAGVGMQPTCTRSAMRNEGWNNCLDHISENYHLTPKTQEGEG